MRRLSKLRPLTPPEARDLAYSLCVFFYPAYRSKHREELGQPAISGPSAPPLSIADFLQWKAQHGEDVISRLNQLRALVGALLRTGMLVHAGTPQDRVPFFAEHYYFAHELSRLESKGKLWLGNALGAPFIAHELRSSLALITVRTPEGDASIGTGLLVDKDLIVTCQHVLKDVSLESITVLSQEVAVRES